jgi:hypothetical protein
MVTTEGTTPKLNLARGKPAWAVNNVGGDANTEPYRQPWKLVDGMDTQANAGAGQFWQGFTASGVVSGSNYVEAIVDLLKPEAFDTVAVISRIHETNSTTMYGPRQLTVYATNDLSDLGTVVFQVSGSNSYYSRDKSNIDFYRNVGARTARYIRVRFTEATPDFSGAAKTNIQIREIKVLRDIPPAVYSASLSVANGTRLFSRLTFPADAPEELTAVAAVYDADGKLVWLKRYAGFADGGAEEYIIDEPVEPYLEAGGRASVFLWENGIDGMKPVLPVRSIPVP